MYDDYDYDREDDYTGGQYLEDFVDVMGIAHAQREEEMGREADARAAATPDVSEMVADLEDRLRRSRERGEPTRTLEASIAFLRQLALTK